VRSQCVGNPDTPEVPEPCCKHGPAAQPGASRGLWCRLLFSPPLFSTFSVSRQETAQLTESQNHRIVRVGRDLCESSSPAPLPKQGHLQQAAQDLVQAGLEYLQRRRIPSLPGQPVPGLCHPQREEVLPCVQLELLLLQFVPVAPCPVSGHH